MNGLLNQEMQAGQPQDVQADPMMAGEQADPALDAAVQFIQEKVYDEAISEEIANLASKQPLNEGVVAALVYRLAEAADEKTEGNVAEEDLSALALVAANEVFEVLDAAGLDAPEAMISKVLKKVALMFAEENELDPAPLMEAFGQVNDDDLAGAAAQFDVGAV